MLEKNDSETLVKLNEVSLKYHTAQGETTALENVSFQIKKGEFIVLVGPSGCGKTTVLSLIAGILAPTHGEILFQGSPIDQSTRQQVGYMLQHDHLFPWSNIWNNARLGLKIQKKDTPEMQSYVDGLLVQYGLSEFKYSFPKQLSGGMRQRAALIRTLALQPSLLLLDEPFSALDYQTRIHVSDDIASIIRGQGKTAILVTHDISEAISLADRIIIFTQRPGKVKMILPVSFENAKTVTEKRQSPEFAKYFDCIWKELDYNAEE